MGEIAVNNVESFDTIQLPAEQEDVFERAAYGGGNQPAKARRLRVVTRDNAEEALSDVVDRLEGLEPAPKRRVARTEDNVDAMLDRALDRLGFGDEPEAKPVARANRQHIAKPALDQDAVDRQARALAEAQTTANNAQMAHASFRQFVAQCASEFPGGMPDVYTDPIGRMKWDAREKELQRALPAINRLYEQAESARRSAFEVCAAYSDAEFRRRNPDWSDDMQPAVTELLRRGGLSDAQIAEMWNGNGGITLSDPRAQGVVVDAARYITGKSLDTAGDAYHAGISYLKEIGFSEDELTALGNGAPVSLRDHRIQQVLADAVRHQMKQR
ncbi:hypothetical protein [Nitrobacter winogradskyi]|uniref:Uncharacterized protein n=2 Tax=Nitrobacter winogradskyi TaxID=913 RepID=A0ACC6AEG1_NITWI|nr:hypothetical protein [Nitrobacter winogradskyi]MCP1998143.1 hypothetical protein [Nitrobacter winogradskyi]GEC15264.1 hypothetical protein NWI01_11560 [Nitrobacter winogradskyi]